MTPEQLALLIQRCFLRSAEIADPINYELAVNRYLIAAKLALKEAQLPDAMKPVLAVFLSQSFQQIDTPQDASRRIPEFLQLITAGRWEDFGATAEDFGGQPTDEFRQTLLTLLADYSTTFYEQVKKESP